MRLHPVSTRKLVELLPEGKADWNIVYNNIMTKE